jgi:benzil reductase ((S)-benzoin forming)
MHLTILTGASRGLGLALAQQLLQPGHGLLTLSRHPAELAAPAGARLEQWAADLAEPAAVAARLEAWLAQQDAAAVQSVTLIHNAGVVSTLGPLADNSSEELSNALRVGLEAPLVLSAVFLRATAGWKLPRKLLFISSGLGRRAMAGSASYCAAKAGMDHLARAIALEEAALANGAKVVSLAPGVIDTDMQRQLRAADPQRFGERERFVALQQGGLLDSPAQAAAKVLKVLARADFGDNVVTDVREAT